MAAGDSEGGETDEPAWATDPALQYLAPEDGYEVPPARPSLLASANKMLCERMNAIAEQLRAGTIPELENVTGAEDPGPARQDPLRCTRRSARMSQPPKNEG